MVMGDLVLLENELTPVMKKLRAAGFEITAVHNHVLNESPRVIYMHYMGHGKAVELAKSLHAALAESKTPLDKPAPPAPAGESPAFVKTIEDTLGTKGRFAGGVLSFGIPRAEAITDHGMTLTTAQGVAEAINFQEAGAGKVATTGDFVLTAEEVNPVISALEEHDIAVTALHSHMLDGATSPVLHALLGRGQHGIGRRGNQGGIEPCSGEVAKCSAEVRDAKECLVVHDRFPSGNWRNRTRPDGADFEEDHRV